MDRKVAELSFASIRIRVDKAVDEWAAAPDADPGHRHIRTPGESRHALGQGLSSAERAQSSCEPIATAFGSADDVICDLRDVGPFALGRLGPLNRSLRCLKPGGKSTSESLTIYLVHSGILEGWHNGSVFQAEAGDICLFGWSLPYDLSAAGLVVSIVSLPAYTFDDLAFEFFDEICILRDADPLKQILIDYVFSLTDRISELSEPQVRLLAEIALRLLRACELLIGAPRGGRSPKQTAIQQYIEANLSDRSLDTHHLADKFGLSRASLYRIFGPLGGVAEYIRKRRLARVRAEIMAATNRHRRIGDIAYEWGFDSGATFSNLFKRAYGVRPRDLRRTHAAPGDPDGGTDPSRIE